MPDKSPARALTILGIETSCDETAAAIVRGTAPGPGAILSNIVASQIGAHAPYGGVVPEIASRAHLEILDSVIERAIAEAGIGAHAIDGVAATAGPGLIGGVMVGLTTAKGVALGLGKPLIGVNHLMGHALTARLTEGTEFPFLLLLVSGGHCQLLGVGGLDDFRLYGTTIDDAVGEAFDKVAKLLGLPYPGGPQVERLAAAGNPRAFDLPRPLVTGHNVRKTADFSCSGRKTAPSGQGDCSKGIFRKRGCANWWWRGASPPIAPSGRRWRRFAPGRITAWPCPCPPCAPTMRR